MQIPFQPIRGTKDILYEDLSYHNVVLDITRNLANLYCYQEIITPIFESSFVFQRTLGEASDILAKETYTFLDRDKTSITLRPEFTAAIVRAFISHGMTQNLPVKFFSTGPVFRHERPQRCRYRQFNQVNFEFFGADSANADIEVLVLAHDILVHLGLQNDVVLEINSIGDIESRNHYTQALVTYLNRHRASLSEDSIRRLVLNPLRILDSKNAQDKAILADAPIITDYLTTIAHKYYQDVLNGLKDFNIPYTHNTKLVRGLDYYTHTVFEFTTANLGAHSAIIAGGRYNGLVKLMGGPDVCAIGFAAGVERLAELYRARGVTMKKALQVHLIPVGEHGENHALILSHQLRSAGMNTYLEYGSRLKKSMQQANKRGAFAVVIFGDEELLQGQYQVKHMSTGLQTLVQKEQLIEFLLDMQS